MQRFSAYAGIDSHIFDISMKDCELVILQLIKPSYKFWTSAWIRVVQPTHELPKCFAFEARQLGNDLAIEYLLATARAGKRFLGPLKCICKIRKLGHCPL
ncbi:hypothetical protein XAP7430_100051 [Xanthomonas phaseoli pv. phaseoli]|uniref:Uncharacterized protein n=1 Tax=Xanthomonas campestris pv. phaseoli TaxID=317013 RepID=A0AB38DUK2_XANCH|nr:hypothetical protein XAP7430_100051 [Xanthomonas phaseoli pv. phaseoli]